MTGDMTPSWLVWVFNSYASLAILFIILVLFCFVFEHETIYTALVLAVFDFYYRTYACNLTECENLQNSDSLRIFVSAHVIITSITAPGMFKKLCLVLLMLFADLTVPKFHFQKKKKKHGEKSRIWYNSADGVTAWARLYVLYIHILFAGWEVCMLKNCDLGLHSFSPYGPTLSR